MKPTIQPTITHSNQSTGPVQSDQDYLPLGSLDSGTNFPIYRRNIDNHIGMNPQESIVTTIP